MLALLSRVFGKKVDWQLTWSVIDASEVPDWVSGSDENEPEPLVLVC